LTHPHRGRRLGRVDSAAVHHARGARGRRR